jgi:hypothetical protein
MTVRRNVTTPSMNQYFKCLLSLISATWAVSFSYSQNWALQPLKKNDSLLALYTWEANDQYHAAGGEIGLTKKGRFRYSAFYPLNAKEHAEGTYRIRKDTLILTSDLQSDNLKVSISYVDNVGADPLCTRLRLPVNSKGDTLYKTYYYLNNDTTFNGHYDPWFPSNIDPLTKVKSLKVMFYDTNAGSAWIPVTEPDKNIKVTVLNDSNAEDRTYRIIKDWKFKRRGNKLIDLSQKK